jgi:hypothetical protein
MNYADISFKIRGIFKLACWTGIFLFGLFLIAEFALANSVSCGDRVTSNVNLTSNLDLLLNTSPAKINAFLGSDWLTI